jgi:hypothetical protein
MQDVWIGLNDISNENQFQWVDGTPYTYNNFHNYQPDNDRGYEHCVSFSKMWNIETWNDMSCSTAAYFVCQWNNESLSIPSPG